MHPSKTLTFKSGHSLEIHSDDDPMHPRTDHDNLGTMVAFHSKYDLGDEKDGINGHGIDHTEFCGWDEMKEWIKRENPDCVILPLYLFDHSGITIRTTSEQFRAFDSVGWDWGQVGFIFVSRDKIKAEYGEHGGRTDEQIEEYLRNEVETYDQYLRGDIWGYILRKPPCGECGGSGEDDGSCWGFYGSDPVENGMSDNLPKEFQEALRAGEFTEVSS